MEVEPAPAAGPALRGGRGGRGCTTAQRPPPSPRLPSPDLPSRHSQHPAPEPVPAPLPQQGRPPSSPPPTTSGRARNSQRRKAAVALALPEPLPAAAVALALPPAPPLPLPPLLPPGAATPAAATATGATAAPWGAPPSSASWRFRWACRHAGGSGLQDAEGLAEAKRAVGAANSGLRVGVGSESDVSGGERDYGTILSTADVAALLADHDAAPSPGTTFKAVLQQALWDASDQFAVCCRGSGRALVLCLRGDICAWERDWLADGGPPVCPRGVAPQLLDVAARADAELLRVIYAWAL
ncbi:hypothetical protein HXX76_014462 [Chlamydomonas incerta]|uniref:Uncharacterized protein n=1 Tax=Chlamydomonas incerta TaxID=51695 RepID=A0A835SC60_CHLIN|nr:hypothetical protein HXX76_014462 [Chlamydomonas incerta]|eukprot:KAG2424582.1 hypothetical protein HXX76_014462 [Chlamydomonas incerta]